MTSETKNHIWDQVTSGRWIMTVTVSLTFAWMATTGMIDADKAVSIMQLVFMFYFMKRAMETGENGK